MVKKPFRGNYLTLENVRVSYDAKTDSVHLTSKDKDLPKGRGFHLVLKGGREAEYILRDLLEKAGMVPEDMAIGNLPEMMSLDQAHNHLTWNHFPLGVYGNGEEAIWNPTASPHLFLTGSAGSGKSVLQRNLIFHCIMNPQWNFYGIDLLRVELSPYLKYDNTVKKIVNTIPESLTMLRDLHKTMMNRYEEMSSLGVNYFTDLRYPPDTPNPVMILIDEASHLLSLSGSASPVARDEDEMKFEIRDILEDIAKLGRAAGFHLVISTQRPESKILSPVLKQNITAQIAAGRMNPIAAKLVFNNENPSRLPVHIKGRGYFEDSGIGKVFQGYFAPQDWIDNFQNH